MARLGILVARSGLAMGLDGVGTWLLVREMQRVVLDEYLGVKVLVVP